MQSVSPLASLVTWGAGELLPSLSLGFLACKVGTTLRIDGQKGSHSQRVTLSGARSVNCMIIIVTI